MYNFSDEYGKGVKDKSPEWMDDFFENSIFFGKIVVKLLL